MALLDSEQLKEFARTQFDDSLLSVTMLKVFEEIIDKAPKVEDRKE